MALLLEQINIFQQVADKYLKGYKMTEIAQELEISPAMVKSYINQYKEFIADRVNEDPDYLDKVAENTLMVLDELNMLTKEAWYLYETAKKFDYLNHMNNALKTAGEFADKRAKLLQLMGAKQDTGNTAKMQRLERVNEIVSGVIKEIIAECPRCRQIAQIELARAFQLMDSQEMGEPEPLAEEIVDAEVVE